MDDNSLLNSNQSGFHPGDSCVHQVLAVTNNICKAFDTNLSRAFGRAWHEGLIYKLMQLGICRKYSKLIQSFLTNQYQGVVLNEESSYWSQVKTGVLQGSVLELLFLLHINDKWFA